MQAVSRCNPELELKVSSNMMKELPPASLSLSQYRLSTSTDSSTIVQLEYEVWQGCAFLSDIVTGMPMPSILRSDGRLRHCRGLGCAPPKMARHTPPLIPFGFSTPSTNFTG